MISLVDRVRRHPGAILALFLAAFGLLYLQAYASYPSTPGNSIDYPLGWWGWFDQSEYLKSARGLLRRDFDAANYLYPPLYPVLLAVFGRTSPGHLPLLPDLVCYLVFLASLLTVARRFYGPVLPGVVCAAMLVFVPIATLTQWVVPWTSTLGGALAGVLIALYSRAEDRAEPFRLISRRDWLLFAGFFVAYGAIAPTRPLDMAVWLPLALAFFLRTLSATVRAAEPGRRWPAALKCMLAAGASGALFVVFYLAFNLSITGSPFGAYVAMASRNGYFPADVLEKALSLLWDSAPVYAEADQALFQRIPVLAAALAICLVTAAKVRDVRLAVIATALFNVLIYLPYGDLLPTGFFRYYNLHYFKWAYPWLAVIGAGQLTLWLRARAWTPVAASVALVAAGALIGIRPVAQELAADIRMAATNTVRVSALKPRRIDFIDIEGLTGDQAAIVSIDHQVWIDGRQAPLGSYRLLPSISGSRLIFHRPVVGRTVDLKLDGRLALADGTGDSALSSIEFGLACWLRQCPAPLSRPLPGVARRGAETVYRFGEGGVPQGFNPSEWWLGEAWGRWSRASTAHVVVATEPGGRVDVSSRVGVLTGRRRKGGDVTLLVNGCKLAKQAFGSMERRTIGGPVPQRCLRADGRLQVEWRVDRATSPRRIKQGEDPRKLGTAVEGLVIRNAR